MTGRQTDGVRKRRNQEEVEQLVKQYETSGMGRQEFCLKHGLSLSTLNRHRKRKEISRGEAQGGGRLIAVEIAKPQQTQANERCGALQVRLPGGRQIEVRSGFDPEVFAQLVRVLERI